MHKGLYTITENRPIARDVYQMRLSGDTESLTAPGQFVNIALPGFFLRRPLSVADWDASGMTLIYKAVGEGTAALSRMVAGDTLDMLCGLGNGFDPSHGEKPLLIGGGVGTPPLLGLAKALAARGAVPTMALGFGDDDDTMLIHEFQALGCKVRIALMAQKQLVTNILPAVIPESDYYYACGPEPMLRAVHAQVALPGQLSFEARMACGFGACMGCTCQTITGGKRICKEGPVLGKEEIVWQI